MQSNQLVSNNDLKYYSSLKQKKYREKEGKFLIEGFHLIEECLSSQYKMETIFLNDDTDEKEHKNILVKASKKNISIEKLPAKLFGKLSETEHSQGIIGVVNKRETASGNNSLGNNVIALDRINDPGNLGTIIRTAYWFGIDSILISTGSADIYNSKVLRSSQGAIFHTNIINDVNLKERLELLCGKGYKVYLLTPSGNTELGNAKISGKCVFVFGNESDGISMEIHNRKYDSIKINGFSNCESLNVAISSGILMYHLKNGLKIV
jgi:TrmH family RNA methyltransferase